MPGDNAWPFVMTSLKTSHLQAVIADLVLLAGNVTSIIRSALKAQLNNPGTSAVK